MSLVRVHHFAVSLDGYATGEDQSFDAPFGHAGMRLLQWFDSTQLGRQVHHSPLPAYRGVDDALVSAGFDGSIGAEIMGRGKFGPQTGPWSDQEWKGWWGDNPPFHTPVFVLTHYPRPSLVMEGGTTFHFINATPQDALAQAKEAANGLDVRIGGGPTMVREFLAAGLIDHMHIVLVPVILGRGTSLWKGLEGIEQGFNVETVHSPVSGVTHMIFQRKTD